MSQSDISSPDPGTEPPAGPDVSALPSGPAMRCDQILVTVVREDTRPDDLGSVYPGWIEEHLHTVYGVWSRAELIESVALVPAPETSSAGMAADGARASH